MGRQRREQWTAIDEEGPSRERISRERTMGRQRSTYFYIVHILLIIIKIHITIFKLKT
jgi:hypothetical protein